MWSFLKLQCRLCRIGRKKRKNGIRTKKYGKQGIDAAEAIEVQAEEEGEASLAVPGCGTISEDTVWTEDGTLKNGELIVEEGVTLTINGRLDVEGNVTVKGGGTIARGDGSAYFLVCPLRH